MSTITFRRSRHLFSSTAWRNDQWIGFVLISKGLENDVYYDQYGRCAANGHSGRVLRAEMRYRGVYQSETGAGKNLMLSFRSPLCAIG